jgi:RNA polymerase sigma factor (sigma-70 family)
VSIETLYQSALQGDSAAEKTLFQQLSVRFGLICQHRIWNKEDAEEIVQEALVTVLGGFKDIEIERSFAAWAHKVLDNKILTYLKTKKARIETIRPILASRLRCCIVYRRLAGPTVDMLVHSIFTIRDTLPPKSVNA